MSSTDIKKLMESLDAIEEADKKPDADGDGVPDWADKKPGKDDHADGDKDEVKETEQLEEAAFAKRHYTVIADVIKNDLGGDEHIARAFATALNADNPRFNEQFFVDYATGNTDRKRPPRV